MVSTKRLMIRRLTQEDWPMFLALQSSAETLQYCYAVPSEQEIREKFESRLAPWSPQCSHWLGLAIAERDSNKPLGVTGFRIDGAIAEVGFMLLPAAEGQGFGTESLQALLAWGQQQYQLSQFKAYVVVGNIGSRRVLEKCGFELRETRPSSVEINGTLHDDWILTLQA